MTLLATSTDQRHRLVETEDGRGYIEDTDTGRRTEEKSIAALLSANIDWVEEEEGGQLDKAGPPRPGLVPQSGDPQAPVRWVRPDDAQGPAETSSQSPERTKGRFTGATDMLNSVGDVSTIKQAVMWRDTVKGSPDGRALLEAVDVWQNAEIDNEVTQQEALRWSTTGETGTPGATIAEAIAASPTTNQRLFRGYQAQKQTLEEVEALFKPGADFNVPPSSFTTSEDVASKFSGVLSPSVSVIFDVEPGSQALNIQPLSGSEGTLVENERVSMGQFKIVGTERMPVGKKVGLRVKLRHVAVRGKVV